MHARRENSIAAQSRRGKKDNRPMRPRKVILCVDDNEHTLAIRSFLLETKGYRVLAMSSSAAALECLEASELVRRARSLRPGLPTLMVSGTVAAFERGAEADAFLPKGACSPMELLERVRILVARKRGPKKAAPPAPAFGSVLRAMSVDELTPGIARLPERPVHGGAQASPPAYSPRVRYAQTAQ